MYRKRYELGTVARLALELLLNIAARRHDAHVLGHQHIRDGKTLLATTQKTLRSTNKTLKVPLLPEFQAALDAMPPSDSLAFLVNYGRLFASTTAFGNKFAEWCKAKAGSKPIPDKIIAKFSRASKLAGLVGGILTRSKGSESARIPDLDGDSTQCMSWDPDVLDKSLDSRGLDVPRNLFRKIGRILWILRRRVDALWGYDVFIAYRRADGERYARQLQQFLKEARIDCFLDSDFYLPGDSLLRETKRHVAKSTVMTLVASPAITEPRIVDWVEAEIDEYFATHPDDAKVIVIDFGAVIAANTRHPIATKLITYLRLSQQSDALERPPAPEVLDAIRQQLAGRKRDRTRVRLFQAIAVALLILSTALAGAGSIAWSLKENAEQRLAAAQIEQSKFLAEKSLQELDPEISLETALAGMPVRQKERPLEDTTWNALIEAEAKRASLRVLPAHGQYSITTVAWSPQGDRVAFSDDVAIRIWHVATGRQLLTIDAVASRLVWSFDGSRLVDDAGHIWSTTTGERLFSPATGKRTLHATRWLSHDPRLLSCASDNTTRIWDSATGRDDLILKHNASVEYAIPSPDEKRILTVTADGTAHIWDATNGTELFTLDGKIGAIRDAAWDATGTFVATTSENTALVWDAGSGRELASVKATYIKRVRLTPGGSQLMVASANGVSLNSTSDGHQISAVTPEANDAEMTVDGRAIAIASNGGVFVWDLARNRQRWLRFTTRSFSAVSWNSDGTQIAAVSGAPLLEKTAGMHWAGEIQIMSSAPGFEEPAVSRSMDLLRKETRAVVPSLIAQFSPDHTTVSVFDTEDHTTIAALHLFGQVIRHWFWSQNGTQLLIISESGAALLWNSLHRRQTNVAIADPEIIGVWWAPNDKWIMTQSKIGEEKLWSTDDGHQFAAWYRLAENKLDALFSPSGNYVVVMSTDGTFILDTVKERKIAAIGAANIARVYWSPHEHLFVTKARDGSTALYALTGGDPIASWRGPSTADIDTVFWSPNDDYLITTTDNRIGSLRRASNGGTIVEFPTVWSADWSPTGDRVLLGCGHTARYLETSTGRELSTLDGGTKNSIGWETHWSVDGTHLVATAKSFFNRAYVLEHIGGGIVRTLDVPEPQATRAIWNQAGTQIAVFAGDRIVSAFGVAHVFDVASGLEIAKLEGHVKNILGAAWSNDAAKLLTWSQDTSARIWDLGTSRELAVVVGFNDFVIGGDWSSDDLQIVTRYVGAPSRFWDARRARISLPDRIDWMRASSSGTLALDDTTLSSLGGASSLGRSGTPLSKCERQAENPFDPYRKVNGVSFDLIDLVAAVPACSEAVAAKPNNGRLRYLLGRSLLRAGDKLGARSAFEQAIKDGYSMALADLGALCTDATAVEVFNPAFGIELLNRAIKEKISIATITLAQIYATGIGGSNGTQAIGADPAKASDYYRIGAQEGEPKAYSYFASKFEDSALLIEDPNRQDALWLEAFRNWTIAYHLSHDVNEQPEEEWQGPLARRAALAWYLAERGLMADVAKTYRDAMMSLAR